MLFHFYFRWQVNGTAHSYGTGDTAMKPDVLLFERRKPLCKRFAVFRQGAKLTSNVTQTPISG